MYPDRSINEYVLLQQLAEGNRQAFRTLYDLHRDKLFYYTLRLTNSKERTEDILQDVFSKVWQQREALKEIRSFDAWLFTLAKNQVLNEFKKNALERSVFARLQQQSAEAIDPVTQSVNFRETRQFLQDAINQLPPQQKKIYQLRQLEGLKNNEIADQLKISPLTVKKHSAQAVRSIRLLLEKQTGLTGALLLTLFRFFNGH
ncbi:RNA polymerase sigma-70 factor [Flavihumibacter sp. CACIAM 22H1]|uniref:RNA polymerase sigma factor n=1 Tax=Flavihumibacter sp. CACIAM 22H1 TaxID=1812911 RepID=UPI0007A822C4|nr:RNA polymerase sigma-70 factor [Flavihumibacter sp. CACIAM 22H1]KYP14630.1 MAG: hypothetical protein A1D16_00835 [Flavihumibacter sp. CACIAM 22H1]